jgi:glutamate synthase domain-containing protein 2
MATPRSPSWRSIINISGMSYGALSRPAVLALSRGAAEAGCWMDTGEGGLAPAHLEGGADIIMQIGTAKYGCATPRASSRTSVCVSWQPIPRSGPSRSSCPRGQAGQGRGAAGSKVTPEIAAIRGIPEGVDSISPNRHRDIANVNELLDMIVRVRTVTGKPVGIKTAIGGRRFLHELCEAILRRGLDTAPDFIAVDGGEGGSGAAPQALADHMALSIDEALPRVVDTLIEFGLRERIRVIAAGKLVTSARAAWALACGADFVNTARGFMFSLGCVQAMRCHQNTCPTGITTHNAKLQRGLVVEEKYLRVANYARNLNKEIDMIAHACGLQHAREFRREHVRLVQSGGRSEAFNMLYPYPEPFDGAPVAMGAWSRRHFLPCSPWPLIHPLRLRPVGRMPPADFTGQGMAPCAGLRGKARRPFPARFLNRTLPALTSANCKIGAYRPLNCYMKGLETRPGIQPGSTGGFSGLACRGLHHGQ